MFVTCSQKPNPRHYPKPDHSFQYPYCLLQVHFNIILTPVFMFPKFPLPCKFSVAIFCTFFLFSHACHVPYPSYSPWYDRSSCIWLGSASHEALLLHSSDSPYTEMPFVFHCFSLYHLKCWHSKHGTCCHIYNRTFIVQWFTLYVVAQQELWQQCSPSHQMLFAPA